MTHLFPHIFSLSTKCFFHWKYEMVFLYPAKLLVSFVLDIGKKKKSCFPSFVSWPWPLIAPCLGLTVLISTTGPDQLSLPQMLINHSQLSKEKKNVFFLLRAVFFLDHFLLLIFLGLFPRIFTAETGRSSRCWLPGSPGERAGAELVSDQKWCHRAIGNKMKRMELFGIYDLGVGLGYDAVARRGSKGKDSGFT